MRIEIGGSAANPPHVGHRALLEKMLQRKQSQKILWLPSGIREDKEGFIDPIHRVAMTQMTLAGLEIELLLDDVYGKNHSTIWWLEKMQQKNPGCEIVWYTGVDSFVPCEKFHGRCEVEARWERGEELIRNWKFLIIPRKGFPHPSELNLPKQFEIFETEVPNISSSDIRSRIANSRPFAHLVVPGVASYIKENCLYNL